MQLPRPLTKQSCCYHTVEKLIQEANRQEQPKVADAVSATSIMASESFFVRNRTAIAVTTLAGVSAVGAYYYYTQHADSQDEDKKKKKKKSKKKGKTSPGAPNGSSTTTPAAGSSKIYPVDSKTGLPNISESDISSLSAKDREAWAMALKEDGNTEFKSKNYENGIAYYTAALQLKNDPVFYSNRSACYAALQDHENVIKDTTEAIKLKPDYTKCVLRRATSYEILENYTEAMFDLTALTIYGGFSNKSVEEVLERVLKKHAVKIVEEDLKHRVPELPSASTISSFFGAFAPETNPEGISEESTGADKFLYDTISNLNSNTIEGYEAADTLVNQAVEAYKVDELNANSENAAKAAIALEYSAAMKFLKNEPTAAAADIAKAIQLQPRARTYVFRALISADKASFGEALQDFTTAATMDPKSPDVFYQLGQLYYLTGDLEKAKDNFTKAMELNPNNVYAHIQLACITYKNGAVKEAEEKFTQAKLKFTTSPEVPNYFGEILADRGEIDLACKQFEISARLQEALPTYSVGALPLINKASLISRESMERIDEAEELLTTACALDPKSELARITLAQIKLQKEDVDEAIVLFEESSKLARSIEEKVQATSFAEATKMQRRIKQDPVLALKIEEVMKQAMMQQQN